MVLPFIELGNNGKFITGVVDGASPSITLPSPLPFGMANMTTAFVSLLLYILDLSQA